MTTTPDNHVTIAGVLDDGQHVELDGELIAPGIAINEAWAAPGYYHLTHVASGATFTMEPIEDTSKLREAATALGALGIDWTQGVDQIDPAVWGRDSATSQIRRNIHQPIADQAAAVNLDEEDDWDQEAELRHEFGMVEAADVIHLLDDDTAEL